MRFAWNSSQHVQARTQACWRGVRLTWAVLALPAVLGFVFNSTWPLGLVGVIAIGGIVLISIVLWLYARFLELRLGIAERNSSYWAASLQAALLMGLIVFLVWKLVDREDEA
jgi:hypothetical protein